jgi:hypothetical protein
LIASTTFGLVNGAVVVWTSSSLTTSDGITSILNPAAFAAATWLPAM